MTVFFIIPDRVRNVVASTSASEATALSRQLTQHLLGVAHVVVDDVLDVVEVLAIVVVPAIADMVPVAFVQATRASKVMNR